VRGWCCFPLLNSEPFLEVIVRHFFERRASCLYRPAFVLNVTSHRVVFFRNPIPLRLSRQRGLPAQPMDCTHGTAMLVRHSLSFSFRLEVHMAGACVSLLHAHAEQSRWTCHSEMYRSPSSIVPCTLRLGRCATLPVPFLTGLLSREVIAAISVL